MALAVLAAAADREEGADESDEGGGKRLLRSHVAAAAQQACLLQLPGPDFTLQVQYILIKITINIKSLDSRCH